MAESSNISWTDATWNTIVGCSKVSDGCTHCYAETLATRYGWTKLPWSAPYAAQNVTLKPQKIDLPRSWKDPKMIFVNSLSDVFHEQVPFDFVSRMFTVMADTPRHTYQILTKRPERMREYINAVGKCWERRGTVDFALPQITEWPLPNVWLGTSVEAQREADIRIPHLLHTPAAVRFLSCEPLLGPLDLENIRYRGTLKDVAPGEDLPFDVSINALSGEWFDGWDSGLDESRISWVIVGGESGNHMHKPGNEDRWMKPEWARSIRDQCVDAECAFFMKQHSATRSGMEPFIIEEDGSHTEWHQFPATVVEVAS